MDQFVVGFALILQVHNIAMMVLGLVIGIVIGAIPGLNVPLAVALALPFTYHLSPLAGLSMLIGIYKGGTYGGSISAILINIPGAPAAAATTLDGYPLARAGKAGKALKLAIYASVVGEIVSDLALILLAVHLARFALTFGPAEYFALGLFALTIIGLVSGRSLVKGLIAGALGLLFANVGMDPLVAEPRLAFGVYELTGGFKFITLIIGLFAISEALVQVEESLKKTASIRVIELSRHRADNRVSWAEWKSCMPVVSRSAPLGVAIGAIPGLGSSIAAFLAYGLARHLSKEPERFGNGALEGVAAAESANNGVCGSTFIPLLTLGVPGDAITAIMLGALMVHGLIPGPTLFTQQGDVVTAFMIGMLITSCLHLVVAYGGLHVFIHAVRLPRAILFPIIIVLSVTGSFVAGSSFFDVFVMLGFGVLGYGMTKFGFPIAPLLIGFILAPMIESGLRQALIISDGSVGIFFERPVAATFLALTLAVVAWVAWSALGRSRRADARGPML
ncbi:MAG: tripartite tricarboxylate transporter permease [Candidatus Methylomirabilia bacterium]